MAAVHSDVSPQQPGGLVSPTAQAAAARRPDWRSAFTAEEVRQLEFDRVVGWSSLFMLGPFVARVWPHLALRDSLQYVVFGAPGAPHGEGMLIHAHSLCSTAATRKRAADEQMLAGPHLPAARVCTLVRTPPPPPGPVLHRQYHRQPLLGCRICLPDWPQLTLLPIQWLL